MKNSHLTKILSLLMLLLLFSCGKKMDDGQDAKDITPVDVVENQSLADDMVAAIIASDVITLKSILALKTDTDLNGQQKGGETLLSLASVYFNEDIISLLVDNGASPELANARGETPLIIAAKMGHLELAKYFYTLSVDLNAKDREGNTALLNAIVYSQEELALSLINAGANISITNNKNLKALEVAEAENFSLSVQALLRSITQQEILGADEKMLESSLSSGDLQSLTSILQKNLSILTKYESLNPYVLVLNSQNQDTQVPMLQLLHRYRANPNGPFDAKVTPLIEAIKLDKLSKIKFFSIQFLLDTAKANPNIVDVTGKTALVWAVESNSLSIVSLLLKKSADKKYSFVKNGKSIKVNTCDVAREVKRKLSDYAEKQDNAEIRSLLNCGLRWPF